MDQDSLKDAVRDLAKIALEQHRQIEKIRKTIGAMLQTLDSEEQRQIDEVLRPPRRTSDEPVPSADETLQRLLSLLQQLGQK
jgi:hypothetical protein